MQKPALLKSSPAHNQLNIQVFSDLNCPFCFAMHERIEALGLSKEVSWCLVEHAPGFNSELKTDEQAALILHEHSLIRQRAREIEITRPHFVLIPA